MGDYDYRTRLAQKYLRRGGNFLDLGCGAGGTTLDYAQLLDAKAFGIDVINGNQCDIEFQVYDGYTIPFDNEFFTSMTVIHVLHHAEDSKRVVEEIARVMRPGSRVMILEDMASSRLQDVFTKVSDVYGNKIRNFARALVGRTKFEMVKIPMTYNIKSYSGWIDLFHENQMELLRVVSIPHRLVEHGAFIFEKS